MARLFTDRHFPHGPGDTRNGTDDESAPPRDMVDWAAVLLGVTLASLTRPVGPRALDDTLSPREPASP